MIRQFRKYATGFLAKFLMLILAGSFVLWGIADVFNTGLNSQYVAKVGTATVSAQAFQQQMNRQLDNYRQLLGQEYSPALISRLGVPQQVLGQMINTLLLQQEAARLGVSLSEVETMKRVSENPNFQGSTGFNKETFQAMLQQAGLSEQAYLDSLRDEAHSDLLLEPLDGSTLVQRPALEALYRLRGERREATLYHFSEGALGKLKAPDDKTLESYYQSHADDFRTPEYRSLAYTRIEPAELRKTLKISSKELRELYESRKDGYRSEERRKVLQLLYDSREKAINAQTLLQQGLSVKEVAEKLKPENKETDLGYITGADLVEAAREAVFALEKGNFSNPIETPFGWHLFQVVDVEPSRIPDFSDIESQLRDELQESRLEDALYQLSTQLEDQLASGAALADAAKELQLPLEETELFTREGLNLKGKPETLPPVKNLLTLAFSGDLESTPEFQTGSDGAYYFATVAAVKESAQPKLKEILSQVVHAWQSDTAAQELEKRVTSLAQKLRKGNKEALLELPYKEMQSGKVSRADAREVDPESNEKTTLPAMLREEMFTLSKGGYTQAYQLPDGAWLIGKLTEIHPLSQQEMTDEDLESLRNELTEQYSNELTEYYLQALRQKYPVEVNEPLLQTLLK